MNIVKKKIAVLVSGGVDSSVALALLKQEGHDVTAFYLKIWLEDELSYLGSCPWLEDLEFAQAVCTKLDVKLEIISMQQLYHDRVVSYMLKEIGQGRTPNPDVLCNSQIKFGAFYDAIDASFDYVATGHYAQIEHHSNISILKKGKDPIKDQTYFLAYLCQAQLKRALFPIGGLEKSEVRALAEKFNLPTAHRKDSQGICFLGKFKFEDFVKAHFGTKIGEFVEFETGKIAGKHEGYWFYTIGQRQGIGLSGGPWYVVSKDIEKNIVFISKNYDAVVEHKRGMIVQNFNFNQGATLEIAHPEFFARAKSIEGLDVRFRHGPAVHACEITVIPGFERESKSLCSQSLKIMLKEESKQGIAAGQFAVLYDGDVCLGGGMIQEGL